MFFSILNVSDFSVFMLRLFCWLPFPVDKSENCSDAFPRPIRGVGERDAADGVADTANALPAAWCNRRGEHEPASLRTFRKAAEVTFRCVARFVRRSTLLFEGSTVSCEAHGLESGCPFPRRSFCRLPVFAAHIDR